MKRDYCGELDLTYKEKSVLLKAWVHRVRDFGKFLFIELRDRTGIVQAIYDKKKPLELKQEYLVEVEGTVKERPHEQKRKDIKTGEIEVEVNSIKIISKSHELPFSIEREELLPGEEIRLKYRYLDLRRPKMQRNIKLRHRLFQYVRNYLSEKGFYEVDTPLLAKHTPEGARDFIIPSRNFPGKFYVLPQSPQLYKQILMVSGVDRYFQIAKCLRDEDLRADRQPEFTQIDIEASFVEPEDIYRLIEEMMKKLWGKILNVNIDTPFPVFTYKEVMEKYGTDKPDLRYSGEIVDITERVKNRGMRLIDGIIEKGGRIKAVITEEILSRKTLKEFEEISREHGLPGILWAKYDESISGPLSNLNFKIIERGTVIALGGGKEVYPPLSIIRKKTGKFQEGWKFLWVDRFPMYSWNEEEERYEPEHHIFSMPTENTLHYLETGEIEKVEGKIYDLVLNGIELGSGSIRVHEPELQEKLMRYGGIDPEDFRFFLDSLKYGAPPHGGIAIGFDRLVALLAGEDSIREVIPFPKTTSCQALMEGAPSRISNEILKELKIRIEE